MRLYARRDRRLARLRLQRRDEALVGEQWRIDPACQVAEVFEGLPGIALQLLDHRSDEWPQLHDSLMGSDILIIATPTWLGQPSSVAKLVLERMDAMISEQKDDGTYAAYNKVAGVVVTGNEDGAHHVITEIAGALIDVGFTIPGRDA